MGHEEVRADVSTSIEVLHQAFAGPLLLYVLRMIGNREEAEEVVQDTLLRAWQHADRFDASRGSMATWLFAIARNLTTDRFRRAAARPRTAHLAEDASIALSEAEVDAALEAWQMAEALGRLSAEHRQAIVDVHYRGYSVVEEASRVGVPVGTIKSRLYYGLRGLRLHLEEMGVVG